MGAVAVTIMWGNKNKQENRKRNADKYCDFCNQNGHTREFCFKIIGYP